MPFTEILMRLSGLCWSDGRDLIRSTLLCQLNMGSENPEANILGLTEAFMHTILLKETHLTFLQEIITFCKNSPLERLGAILGFST